MDSPSGECSSTPNSQPATDPCAQVVHSLMCYHQGGENPEFIRKAIESLVKKLKDRREQLDSLISAVTTGGKQPTNCVSIHRSLDGRLQVAGRKGVPNVVYARIWRWPNVNKNELVKLPLCSTPTNHPDLICINPYHYDRIVSSGLSSIDLSSSFRMDSLPSTSATENFNIDANHPSTNHPTALEYDSSGFTHQQQQEYPNTPQNSYQPNRVLAHLACGNMGNRGIEFPQNCKEWSSHSQLLYYQQSQQLQPHYNLELVQMPQLQTFPQHWCSIAYFELDTQVGGETFKAPWTMDEVLIDGGMDPAGAEAGRFCLGAISNVHRTEASERARLHIGKGVRLINDRESGNVFVECLRKDIFVRSYFLDFEHGLQYGSAVHKICAGAYRKVFDLRWAYAEMCEQKQSAQMAVLVQAYAVAGIAQHSLSSQATGTGVDDLRRTCCTIALSFVKGWGAGYARTNIKETPCWVEIQLYRPLQLLNEQLLSTA